MQGNDGPAELQARLDSLYARISRQNDLALGYPSAKDFDCSDLLRFLSLPINNVGDPFAEGTYQVETRAGFSEYLIDNVIEIVAKHNGHPKEAAQEIYSTHIGINFALKHCGLR